MRIPLASDTRLRPLVLERIRSEREARGLVLGVPPFGNTHPGHLLGGSTTFDKVLS
jgi:hypothetical protein